MNPTPKKRAPRKRAAPRVSMSDGDERAPASPRRRTTTTTRTPRTRAPRVDSTETERPVRKSPTPLSSDAAATRQVKRQRIILATIVFIGIAASAGVGFTDTGKVDIEARIEARNERIRNNTPTEQDLVGGVEAVTNVAGNSARPVAADGGMTGRGTGGRANQPTATTEVKTATTTVDVTAAEDGSTASTTDSASVPSTDPTDEATSTAPEEGISDSDSQPEESLE